MQDKRVPKFPWGWMSPKYFFRVSREMFDACTSQKRAATSFHQITTVVPIFINAIQNCLQNYSSKKVLWCRASQIFLPGKAAMCRILKLCFWEFYDRSSCTIAKLTHQLMQKLCVLFGDNIIDKGAYLLMLSNLFWNKGSWSDSHCTCLHINAVSCVDSTARFVLEVFLFCWLG